MQCKFQAIQHDAEELVKWDRAMQRCHQTLVDSARYAAWHNVSPRIANFTVPLIMPDFSAIDTVQDLLIPHGACFCLPHLLGKCLLHDPKP